MNSSEHRKANLEAARRYRAKNRDKVLASQRAYAKAHALERYLDSQTLKSRYQSYKRNAKKRGFSFEFSLDEFQALTSEVCFYCGKFSQGKMFTGIDRVESSLGYTLENCLPCCDVCNYMKGDYTYIEFFSKIKDIYDRSLDRFNGGKPC